VILVDTSVWVALFRRARPYRLEQSIDFEEIATCLPVIQEVLQGFREERAYRTAKESLLALLIIESPMEESLFIEAAGLYRSARRQGLTVRSSVDCLIAACALRHDMPVLQDDRDFDLISKVAPLRVQDLY
jgi:predicted nucleic acid-binding protein